MRNLIRKQMFIALALALPLSTASAASGGSKAGKDTGGGSTLGGTSSQIATGQAPGRPTRTRTTRTRRTANDLGTSSSQLAPGGSRTGGSQTGSQLGLSASQIAGRSSRVASQSGLAVRSGSRTTSGPIRQIVDVIDTMPALSEARPALIGIEYDDSTSMQGPFAGQPNIKKMHAVTDVGNGLISGLIDRHSNTGPLRNRVHLSVAGYNTGNAISPAMKGRPIVTLKEMADGAQFQNLQDNEGQPIQKPVWFHPTASGSTPMTGSIKRLRATYAGWKARPQGEHLVIGINVTDGESMDGDPADELAGLQADVKANGGKLLMTNIHIAEEGGDSFTFPDEADAARMNQHGQMLFRMSSPVPPELAEQLGTKPGARMMAYNATFEKFEEVFKAGSSVALQP